MKKEPPVTYVSLLILCLATSVTISQRNDQLERLEELTTTEDPMDARDILGRIVGGNLPSVIIRQGDTSGATTGKIAGVSSTVKRTVGSPDSPQNMRVRGNGLPSASPSKKPLHVTRHVSTRKPIGSVRPESSNWNPSGSPSHHESHSGGGGYQSSKPVGTMAGSSSSGAGSVGSVRPDRLEPSAGPALPLRPMPASSASSNPVRATGGSWSSSDSSAGGIRPDRSGPALGSALPARPLHGSSSSSKPVGSTGGSWSSDAGSAGSVRPDRLGPTSSSGQPPQPLPDNSESRPQPDLYPSANHPDHESRKPYATDADSPSGIPGGQQHSGRPHVYQGASPNHGANGPRGTIGDDVPVSREGTDMFEMDQGRRGVGGSGPNYALPNQGGGGGFAGVQLPGFSGGGQQDLVPNFQFPNLPFGGGLPEAINVQKAVAEAAASALGGNFGPNPAGSFGQVSTFGQAMSFSYGNGRLGDRKRR